MGSRRYEEHLPKYLNFGQIVLKIDTALAIFTSNDLKNLYQNRIGFKFYSHVFKDKIDSDNSK